MRGSATTHYCGSCGHEVRNCICNQDTSDPNFVQGPVGPNSGRAGVRPDKPGDGEEGGSGTERSEVFASGAPASVLSAARAVVEADVMLVPCGDDSHRAKDEVTDLWNDLVDAVAGAAGGSTPGVKDATVPASDAELDALLECEADDFDDEIHQLSAYVASGIWDDLYEGEGQARLAFAALDRLIAKIEELSTMEEEYRDHLTRRPASDVDLDVLKADIRDAFGVEGLGQLDAILEAEKALNRLLSLARKAVSDKQLQTDTAEQSIARPASDAVAEAEEWSKQMENVGAVDSGGMRHVRALLAELEAQGRRWHRYANRLDRMRDQTHRVNARLRFDNEEMKKNIKALAEERRRLRARIEELEEALEAEQGIAGLNAAAAKEEMNECDTLRARLDKAEEALETFGMHHARCDYLVYPNRAAMCSCGFDRALDAIRPGESGE